MKSLDRFQAAMNALPEGIKAAEASAVLHDDTTLTIRDGAQVECTSFLRNSIRVFASNGKSTGRISTENMDEEPLSLLRQAAENAEYVRGGKKIALGPVVNVRPAEHAETLDDLLAFGIALEKAALERAAEVTHCSVRRRTLGYRTVNSLGADNCYQETEFIIHLGIKADGDSGGISIHADSLGSLDAAALAQRAVDKAHLTGGGHPVVNLTSGTMDVVFSSEVAASMMVISWMGLVGAHTERSAAVYPFNPATVISYEKTVPDTWANGIRELADAETLTGGMRRTPANRTPEVEMISTPSKVYMAPSGKSVPDLLATMGTGLFVTGAFDVIHSVAPSNGDFAILCDGILYENGTPKGKVERALVSGNMQDFMRNARATADDLQLNEFMQKGYAYGSPSIFIEKLTVTGKG